MNKVIKIFILLLLVYLVWKSTGLHVKDQPARSFLEVAETLGHPDSCSRNIVAVQPFMEGFDYADEFRFFNKLNSYLMAADSLGMLRDKTTVLFPEYLGTWLVTAREKKAVYEASSLTQAMTLIIARQPLRFLSYFWKSTEEDAAAASIFRMQSAKMAGMYVRVFSNLAKAYQVTIVAGSIVLPGAAVSDGLLVTDINQSLENVSAIFNPDGTLSAQLVRKAFPISSELPFTRAVPVSELPIFDLPIGRTAVLICADSWYPESYNHVTEQQVEIVLVPSFCAGNHAMTTPWGGYDGSSPPDDVSLADMGQISEGTAWKNYALPGRIPQHASLGVNVFLRGNLWGLGSDGDLLIIIKGELLEVSTTSYAGIWNICF